MLRRSLRYAPHALSALLLVAGCVSVQDFTSGGPDTPVEEDAGIDAEPALGDAEATPEGTPRWQWFNPAPAAKTLLAIGGTSEKDLWVAGEAGTIAHFDGTRWDLRQSGPAGARYFAVGTRAKNDVWIAGTVDGRTEVLHYDGKDWVTSYPFAGSSFGGFSHGPGKRLFAFMGGTGDWDILELSSDGTWEKTDQHANDVFGWAVDIWVTPSGEAWALTSGAMLLRLPADSKTWVLESPVAGKLAGTKGLGLGGAGSRMCAFYTGKAIGGTGYAWYDGTWHNGPTDPDELTYDAAPHGTRVGCLSDGSGFMAYDGEELTAGPTSAPGLHMPSDFAGEQFYGGWSLDGARIYAVGSLGAFMTRTEATDWTEKGPTLRRDLLAVDIGNDGSTFIASAFGVVRDRGGEIVFARDGKLAPYSGGGIQGPQLPVAVTAIDAKYAWVLSDDNSQVGITQWNGRYGLTNFLRTKSATAHASQAIWAATKDDVWASAENAMWHYDGKKWNDVSVKTTYRSIHGSGPDDVWFAGDASVAHWDGKSFELVTAVKGKFSGVWSSTPARVWLWGPDGAVLFDGKKTTPVEKALHASTEWQVAGIAESTAGDVFVLTKKSVGTQLLWFDPTYEKLVDIVSSDLELTQIRGRGDNIAAIGAGGAFLQFTRETIH